MARPRAFDETEVLEAAMTLFRRQGYEATTFRQLEDLTGVGVRSLVNTFGDKDSLFLKALALYHQQVRALVDLMFDPPSLAAVESLFMAFTQPLPEGDISHQGCLMVNTVFELGQTSDAVKAAVSDYREMWRGVFLASLNAGAVPGAEEKADFLVGSLWGALSQIRLARDHAAAAPVGRVTAEIVQGWAAGAAG